METILVVILVLIFGSALGGMGLVGRNIYKDSHNTSRIDLRKTGRYGDLRAASIEAGKLNQKQRWNDEIESINDYHNTRKNRRFKWLSSEDDSTIESERIREVNQTVKRFTMSSGASRMGSIHPRTGENHKHGIGRAGHGRRAHLRSDGTDPNKPRKRRDTKPKTEKPKVEFRTVTPRTQTPRRGN